MFIEKTAKICYNISTPRFKILLILIISIFNRFSHQRNFRQFLYISMSTSGHMTQLLQFELKWHIALHVLSHSNVTSIRTIDMIGVRHRTQVVSAL